MTEAAERGATSGIQVIARAAEMLRVIQASPGGLSQADIAHRLGLARSTVHRILSALEDEGFVSVQASRGRYRLGPEMTRMAEAGRRELVARIRPLLVNLSRDLNETVDLSILDGNHITFIDQVVAPRALRAVSAVGESFPLHCTAPGKAILAALPADEIGPRLVGRLHPMTPNTITTMSALRKELKQVARNQGLGIDREEHHEGISALGVAIVDVASSPIAISVPVPSQRFAGRETEIAQGLLSVRDQIRVALTD